VRARYEKAFQGQRKETNREVFRTNKECRGIKEVFQDKQGMHK
jgi:hypothetical protein